VLIKKNRIPVLHIITIGILPSFLKKIIYRLRGYNIASDVKLNIGCVVIGKDVEIGKKSSIGFFTIVRANKIKIGRFVKIGAMSVIDTEYFSIDDDARINEQVYIGGMKTPESALIMGKRTIIMQASYINPTQPIIIGDDSGIGGHCLLFTHGSWNSVLEGYPVKFAPITIGKKVWLPWRVFVMPGVTIGDGVVVGADSLLNKDIPAHSLVAGSPAKIIKSNFPVALSETETKKITGDIFIEFIAYLKHHLFNVTQTNGANGFELTITNKNNQAFLKYEDTFTNLSTTILSDSILVMSKGNTTSTKGYAMVISLEERERIGSSNVGEEFVSFLSRYGVRFNRLD
jgi:acetyltransferase-like isoleucine patch superfamily enzyme